jgi:hypothetical protein
VRQLWLQDSLYVGEFMPHSRQQDLHPCGSG